MSENAEGARWPRMLTTRQACDYLGCGRTWLYTTGVKAYGFRFERRGRSNRWDRHSIDRHYDAVLAARNPWDMRLRANRAKASLVKEVPRAGAYH